ncbi:hypothetical protein [Algoriphagus pacificus]|uniref:Oligosaccharide repeat unit polymerase n=1 Tax=Algoriphagus pacificus TaxID=2811234 RepID=A0ABS3CGX6_9BACT|nr:hypothetical protein [Algoriphagus pacificus]MBN7816352.1 hypothetical protein [Algoriphagus pacificus]
MVDKFIIFFLEVCFGINFNFIGTISLSEIFLISTFFIYFKRNDFLLYPELKILAWFYTGLFFSQILSELVVGNSFSNSLKGLAVTIVSFFHFYFLFKFFIKNRYLVLFALLGMLFRSLIFGTQFQGDLSDVVSGEGATYLKFYIAPIVGNIILMLSLFLGKLKVSVLTIIIGFIFVVLGARSYGSIIALTGLISFYFIFKPLINKKIIFFTAIFLIFISYGFYFLYVSQVLNGNIESGNSWQIKSLENPYNPLNLIYMGRTETIVGFYAFYDSFFFGHGAWAEDTSGKYHYLMEYFKNSNRVPTEFDVIPSHSVLVGSGMQNGIFSFLFMFLILYYFTKRGILSISKFDKFYIIIIFFILQLIWNGIFSPSSHFRYTLPLYFSFILSSYIFMSPMKLIINYENLFRHNR